MLAQVAGQLRVAMRMREHQVLHDELDVYHAAAVVLEVEQVAAVGVAVRDLLPESNYLSKRNASSNASVIDLDASASQNSSTFALIANELALTIFARPQCFCQRLPRLMPAFLHSRSPR